MEIPEGSNHSAHRLEAQASAVALWWCQRVFPQGLANLFCGRNDFLRQGLCSEMYILHSDPTPTPTPRSPVPGNLGEHQVHISNVKMKEFILNRSDICEVGVCTRHMHDMDVTMLKVKTLCLTQNFHQRTRKRSGYNLSSKESHVGGLVLSVEAWKLGTLKRIM